ncbi:OmpA family protein [Geomonas anaerohicana]|uniref:OmpA family protein n=1 Tax=Geomonas anaerohicana TaxID=2798583 RepID=A0ABS0Y9D3_9BACT|nr:OmpA family protein [Geomonas anaerohicana]MBJ6748905.1 OmpA family protein [Geomonas anaerohicana]
MTNRIDNILSSLSGLRAGELAGARGDRRGRGTSVPRAAAELRPVRCRVSTLFSALLLALPLLFPVHAAMAAVNGDQILNRATFSCRELPPLTSQVTVTVMVRTASTAEFLKYSPTVAGASSVTVPATSFYDGSGTLEPLSAPVATGSQNTIDLSKPVQLTASSTYHAGEPLFVRVTDPDQNLDHEVAETVQVTITDPATGDTEVLQLTESGPDTGVFMGYIQTSSRPPVAKNGILSVSESSEIKARYVDKVDGSDSSAVAAIVDPFGIVFDSVTGKPVDGVTVELIDADTGLGATILGDNGVAGNTYPSKVVSGSVASDSEGRTYAFTPGGYRFPFVAPGNYLLKVTPPDTYTAPSTVTTGRLQALPGAPFNIQEPGSRGEVFVVPAGPAIRVDIPIDPKIGTLWLRKSASKSVVSAGDYLSYDVTLQNPDTVGTVFNAVVTDRLPSGFRYQKGSARLNGAPVADPAIATDGSTLTFNAGTLPPKGSALIRYVVVVGAGAKPGTAVNTAVASTNPPVSSLPATAAVTVQEPFLQSRNIIMGRVFVGACGENPADNKKGMEGVGIYLEDGTFVVSDKLGMFHFEGVASGTHVVQLDIDSVPEGYQVQQCEKNSRFAGRAYSQFAELQGGTMWRTDFYLGRLGDKSGAAATGNTGSTESTGSSAVTGGTGAAMAVAAAVPPTADPRYQGEVTLEMISAQNDDIIEYRIPMQTAGVQLGNLQLTVDLPPGVRYHMGSSTLKATSHVDPQVDGNRLNYALGAADAAWGTELRFKARVEQASQAGTLQTKARLSFDTAEGKGIVTPEVDNILSLVREQSRVPLAPVVLHPHFPTFGADLSDEDRKQLSALAELLRRFNLDRIEVTGHTDQVRIAPRSRGIYADNTALSFARARNVGRYLTAALHLPPEALYLTGRGEKEPVASNRTEAGRALNRRVEVKVSLSQNVQSTRAAMIKDRSEVKKQITVPAAPVVTAATAPTAAPAAAPTSPTSGTSGTSGAGGAGGTSASPPAGSQALKPAQERLELYSALHDGVVHHRIKLVGGQALTPAPLPEGEGRYITVNLALPKSLLYMNGTTRLGGSEAADPAASDAGVVYRIEKIPQNGKLDLRLQSLLDPEVKEENSNCSVTVQICDRKGAPIKTFTATAELSDSMEEIERPDVTPLPAVSQVQAKPTDDVVSSDFEEKIAKGKPQAADPNADLHVKEKEGILSPADGTVLASQVNAVQIVLNSALTPVLTLDGQVIPPEKIGFKMKDKESEKSLYTFIGIDFGDKGEHVLRLKGMDSFGVARYEQSAKVIRTGEIVAIRLVSADGNVADGRTPVRVRIELLDQDGKPVPANAELALKGGELRPYLEPGTLAVNAGSGLVAVDAQGWMKFQPVTASGAYRAQLAYNKATLDLETYVKPKMRDWILVGLAEGTAGYNTVTGHMQNLKDAGAQEHIYDEERLAFYAKGSVKGEWLFTMSYDSAKKSTGVSGNSLFQNIDPNAFYTIYGDASAQAYDAASQRKIFLKVERDQFSAVLGDFDTGLSVTELSRYSRRLNGVKTEFRSKEFEVTAFGSETGQSFVKDELRGDGTSGLYRLSRRGLVANSEKITIESRDRFHSERVVDSRLLSRFIDYSIDYEAGTIFFKSPVFSKDDQLNPIYIVVDYEVTDAGGEALTYGGRAGVKLLDGKLKVGGSYIHEGHVSGDSNLYGADATATLGPGTKVRAEIATTQRNMPGDKASGNAYLAEITHLDQKLEGKAYFREQEDDFGLGQQKGSEAGTRKFGAEGTFRVNEQVSLGSQLYRQYNLTGNNVMDFAEAQAGYTDKAFTGKAGLRYANDSLADGNNATSVLGTVGASWKTLNQRLTLRADHEQALFSKNQNADYPTRTVLGADFQIIPSLLLFAQQEFTQADDADTNTTRVGMKATPWSGGTFSSSVANDRKENDERTFANVGLAQKWQVNSFWSVDGGFDRSQTIRRSPGYQFDAKVPSASGGEDYSAVSLGATYQEKKLLWSNRLEYRDGETDDKWGLITGLTNEQGLFWGWTGKLQVLHTRATDGARSTDADLRLGLAYRPPVTRWILLDRLDLTLKDEKGSGSSTQGRRIVNNLNANFRPDKHNQLSLQYGVKYVLEQLDDQDFSGVTDLFGAEGRHDLSDSWDIGLRGSVVHGWQARQVNYSLGGSIGCNVMQNAWLSLGYNLLGFRDRDFSAANYTAQGPFLQFRFKFDQNSVKEGLAALNRGE